MVLTLGGWKSGPLPLGDWKFGSLPLGGLVQFQLHQGSGDHNRFQFLSSFLLFQFVGQIREA